MSIEIPMRATETQAIMLLQRIKLNYEYWNLAFGGAPATNIAAVAKNKAQLWVLK